MIERFEQNRTETSTSALQDEGFEGFEGLLQALSSNDLAVRAEAAFLLGRLRDRRAVPSLQAAVEDASARVRVEAAQALARLGEEAIARENLRAELTGAFFDDAPLRAARALALLGDVSGWPRVLEALHSDLPSNRMEAVQALQAFVPLPSGAVDPVAALIDATSDSEAIVRADAIAALRGLDDPRAVDTLRKVDAQ
jgi:HEAT repeat protein